ncbi:MAG: WecB/TagA/CpsF family glycosyltransferase [Terracidiphilus sp.]
MAAESEREKTAEITRANILGIGVSDLDMNDALRMSEALIRLNGRGYICVSDVHSVIEGHADPTLGITLNRSFLTVPDGMPLVWAARAQGHTRMRRVYGPDFMLELCRFGVSRGYRHFFCGGKPGIAEELKEKLAMRVPGIQVVGTYTPPFRELSDTEEASLAGEIALARPNVLWVGLGSPKQERFLARYTGLFEANLMVGVGAAFDFHAGAVKEAPRWLHSTGLQWVYRLMREPRRLWMRYLVCVPCFLWQIALQLTGLRKFALQDTGGDMRATELTTRMRKVEMT